MLEVTGIYKKFRNRQILKGVSFQAEPGMCVGIAGGNGAGRMREASGLTARKQWENGKFLKKRQPTFPRKIR